MVRLREASMYPCMCMMDGSVRLGKSKGERRV